MESKTVVYGLGQSFDLNKEKISKRYNVVAYCDKDFEKVKNYSNGITREYLQEHIANYDKVLITAAPLVIVSDLVENLAIPQEKISIMAYDDAFYQPAECNFYGENLEDAVILLILSKLGLPVKNTRYLEIGTNDPIKGNNSFNLYKNGARGVLIDPLPGLHYLVQMVRPEDQVIIAAITDSPKSKTASFFECQNSGLSSLYREHHKKWEKFRVEETQVKVLGINDVLQSMTFVPDVLLIDAEGEDEKITRAINYEKYCPIIIVVEICDMNSSAHENLIEFMKTKGYKWYTTIKNTNAIFVLAERLA